MDPLHRLLAPLLTNPDRLDHRPDILLAGQLQHGQHLRPAADMAAADGGAVGREILRPQRPQRLVGQADVVEGAVDGERAHVFRQVERVRHVGGVEDEVEGEGPFRGPALLRREDECLGAQLQGVGFFVGRVREGVRFGAEGAGPEESEVAEAAAAGWVGFWAAEMEWVWVERGGLTFRGRRPSCRGRRVRVREDCRWSNQHTSSVRPFRWGCCPGWGR